MADFYDLYKMPVIPKIFIKQDASGTFYAQILIYFHGLEDLSFKEINKRHRNIAEEVKAKNFTPAEILGEDVLRYYQNIVELAAMEFKEARGFISEAHCRAYCFRFVDSLEKQLKDAAKRLAINEITRIEDLCALAVEYSPCT